LCCLNCYFKNLHDGHKLLEISDINSLEKENITIDASSKDLDDKIQKIIKLKNKIEEEINKINSLYDKVSDDLSKSFKIKHEQLKKEEDGIKEKLDNEVTKVKENLENFLSECNSNIKISQIIKRGIEKFDKEEKNMMKTLSYVSKINKVKNDSENILNKLIKSLNFYYVDKKANINYEKYYINFIQPTKFTVGNDSSSISWNKINIKNIDSNKIKYIIEFRKENNKNFEKLYEGNDNKCSIKKLLRNINYEFRICISYNDIKNINENIQKVFIPFYNKEKIEKIYKEIDVEYNISSMFDREEVLAKIEEFNFDKEKIARWIEDNL
jgi:hypothetical protein